MSSQKILFCSLIFNFLVPLRIHAQIIPDNSLGAENSIVTPQDTLSELIEGGAIRDSNLFHSFSEFNVNDGARVDFASPDGIANILTRVTGNNISEILGTLGVDGTANLFLLNPNGIVFGENSTLEINGSFFATTAESFVFGEGLEFSAINPETAPLLTINLIPGLQIGSNSGNITVQDQGHLITGGIFLPSQDNLGASGLEVKTGQTLGLIAKEINLDGGILKASGGDIQLSAIEKGLVQLKHNLQSWQFDISLVEGFGDLNLSNRTIIDNRGLSTGNIELKGKNINLIEDSQINIRNFGEQPSGKIILEATDTIRLVKPSQNSLESSGTIATESLNTGSGGNILVSGNNLLLDNGSVIVTRSFNAGNTGNIDININELIDLRGFSPLDPSIPSNIGTVNLGQGQAGRVEVSARNTNLSNGAIIGSYNLSSGMGGVVEVNIEEDLSLSGFNPVIAVPTSLGSFALGTGNSGSLIVNTARLSVENGASISTSSLAQGNAGTLEINASDFIQIKGASPEISNRSAISSSALILDPIFRQTFGLSDIPSGNAGNVTINTPSLITINDALVSVLNQGLGDGGNLEINSDLLLLENGGSIAAFSASGEGGNIALNIEDSLFLRNGSAITAEAIGTFTSSQLSIDGGNITINTDLITLLENSSINANAFEGNGGEINITTQGFFVSADSLVSASSQFGLDGNINIDIIENQNQQIIEDRNYELIAIDTLIKNRCFGSKSLGESSFTYIGRGSTPVNPETRIDEDYYLVQVDNDSPKIVEANAIAYNSQGKIALISLAIPPDLQYPGSTMSNGCPFQ